MIAEEDDMFNEYPFYDKITTPVLTMQDIFINEKGKEYLRHVKIRLNHQKKKESHLPDFESIQKQAKQLEQVYVKQEMVNPKAASSSPKVSTKKTLQINAKTEPIGNTPVVSSSFIKVTTTILKDEPKPTRTTRSKGKAGS